MRLNARLGKLEQVRSASIPDLSNLTDEELIAAMRDAVKHAGIDWSMFKNDPLGEVRKKIESMPDDGDLISYFERTTREGGENGLHEIMKNIDTLEKARKPDYPPLS